MHKAKATPYLVSAALLILFFFNAFKVERHETGALLLSYCLLFALYTWIILKDSSLRVGFWIASAIIFRFVVLFSTPNLSDDFYRFIWDGRLLSAGFHPFAHPPSYYIENNLTLPGINESLYAKLNSKDYYTVYPPVAQLLFWVSAKFSSSAFGSLIILKMFNFLAEIGSIILLGKLLKHFNQPREYVLIYALNPLIILELTANAHLEALMICFLLASLYFILKKRLVTSAFFLALSIGVKLIPLIFLPALLTLLGRKAALKFYLITLLICVLLFLPLLDMELIAGFQNSLSYYFSRFEFNGSLYYLVRSLGYLFFGFNIIHIAGSVLAFVGFILILRISLKGFPHPYLNSSQEFSDKPGVATRAQWNLIHTFMGSLLIYLLFTTTVHPWYILTLVPLSVLTGYRFVVVWTFMIFLTYAGYTVEGYKENLWIISVEYIVVLGYFAFELWKRKLLYSPA